MKIVSLIALVGLIALILQSCKKDMSKHYPIKKGEMIVLQQPYHFIDNPGVDYLIPETSGFFDHHKANSKGIVPPGVNVKFLGVYAENGFMVDTKIKTYGRIAEGVFQGRKIDLHYVIEAQEKEAYKALPEIEREYFSNQ